jgi:uroporphyrinogen-III decarboxylase
MLSINLKHEFIKGDDMAQLTSKERLLRTWRREPTDRVPVSTYEMVGWDMNSWYNKQPSYKKLMQVIREKTDCLYSCSYSAPDLAEQKYRTVEKWEEGDLVFHKVTLHTPKGNLTAVYRDQKGLLTTWTTEHFLKTIDDLDKWLSLPYEPGEVTIERVKAAEKAIGDKGILVIEVPDPILIIAELFRFEHFMLNWMTDRERILYAMDVIFERQYATLKKALTLGATGPSIRLVGPEYGTPPYFPPEDFHELVVKYDKRIIDLIHQYGGLVRVHCHGRIGKVLPMFVEMGADGADPVEGPPSGDIELAEVKRLYGDKLVLFGNMQLRDLEFLTTAEIDKMVKKMMEAAKKGGGYVIMPTASPIDANLKAVTEANYYAYIEAALKYGKY